MEERDRLDRRLLLLPLAWVAFGLGEVFALQYLLGGILSIAPTLANDKPIGGSVLPIVFLNLASVLIVLGVSLYALGYWEPNFSTRKTRTDIFVLAVLLVSGFLLFYSPLALFPIILSVFYFLAGNIE